MNELVLVKVLIPVDLLIIDTLSVGVNMKIPVDVLVPVKLPLNTTATISFPEAIPVNGNIPLALTIPVNIPLEKTDLAVYFKKMAKGLRDLTVLKVKVPKD